MFHLYIDVFPRLSVSQLARGYPARTLVNLTGDWSAERQTSSSLSGPGSQRKPAPNCLVKDFGFLLRKTVRSTVFTVVFLGNKSVEMKVQVVFLDLLGL